MCTRRAFIAMRCSSLGFSAELLDVVLKQTRERQYQYMSRRSILEMFTFAQTVEGTFLIIINYFNIKPVMPDLGRVEDVFQSTIVVPNVQENLTENVTWNFMFYSNILKIVHIVANNVVRLLKQDTVSIYISDLMVLEAIVGAVKSVAKHSTKYLHIMYI